MTQNESQIQAVERMEALIGQQDWVGAAHYFTPNVLYKVAAREAVVGLASIREYMQEQNRLVRWQGHTVRLKVNDNDIVYQC